MSPIQFSICKNCGAAITLGAKRCKPCRGQGQWNKRCYECGVVVASTAHRCYECEAWRTEKKQRTASVDDFLKVVGANEAPAVKRGPGRPIKGNFIDGCIPPNPDRCWETSGYSRCERTVEFREKRLTGPKGAIQVWGYCDHHWKLAQKCRGVDRDWHECFLTGGTHALESIYLIPLSGLGSLQAMRKRKRKARKLRCGPSPEPLPQE